MKEDHTNEFVEYEVDLSVILGSGKDSIYIDCLKDHFIEKLFTLYGEPSEDKFVRIRISLVKEAFHAESI